jgi:hypothetical protein
MPAPAPAQVLVVTDHGAAAPDVLEAIRARTAAGAAGFHVLVPNPARAEWNPTHPERRLAVEEAERTLATAVASIEAAAGQKVLATVSIRHDPMDAIEDVLRHEACDEIILAVGSHEIQRRLHVDLPHRLAHLGIPVTAVHAAAPA